MNRIAAIALFVGAALMTTNSATAQSSVVKVNVPFAFTVNNTFLPAGSYFVGFDSANPELLVIRDQKNAVKAWKFSASGVPSAREILGRWFFTVMAISIS